MLVCPAEFTDDELRLVLGPLATQLGIHVVEGDGDNSRLFILTL